MPLEMQALTVLALHNAHPQVLHPSDVIVKVTLAGIWCACAAGWRLGMHAGRLHCVSPRVNAVLLA